VDKSSVAWRIGLFYAALFAVPGVHLPFWSVWLKAQGLNPEEIAIVLSTSIWLRLLAGPAAAQAVDRSGARRLAVQVLSAASLISFIGYSVADGFASILLVSAVFAITWSPIQPFTENIAVLAAARHGLQYGRLRLWGSLSFLIAAYLAGLWLKGRSEEWIFWMIMGGVAAMGLASLLLPDIRIAVDRPHAGAPLKRLLKNRDFLIFLGTGSCLQGTHAALYTFATLYWRELGLSDAAIGFLWAEGVLAEVILFAFGQRVGLLLGGVGLLAVGVLGGLVRWSLLGAVADFQVLVLLQLLHAATFGAAHLGAMRLLAEHAEPGISATAQSLYGAANAALLASATMAVGPIYAAQWPGLAGGWVYPAMLPLTLLGGVGTYWLWRRRGSLSFA